MSHLEPHHELVGQGYDASGSETQGYDYEVVRLEQHSPVEYAITLRYIQRYITDGVTVADIGAGAGHYSESLARRNCSVHLVDVAQRLLDAAVARLTEAGLERQIASVTRASATALSFLPDACCDVVLVLGPLYHLGLTEERSRAIAEAASRRAGVCGWDQPPRLLPRHAAPGPQLRGRARGLSPPLPSRGQLLSARCAGAADRPPNHGGRVPH